MPLKKPPQKRARKQTEGYEPSAKRGRVPITEKFLYGKPRGLPSPKDINQRSDRANCYMLAPLISLARNNPKFIKNELINIKDGEAAVKLYRCTRPRGRADKHIYRVGDEVKFNVTREDIERWKSGSAERHRANWVNAVEFAYAKLMAKSYGGKPEQVFEKGSAHSTEALVILTGKTAEYSRDDISHYDDEKRDRAIRKKDRFHFPHKFPKGAKYNKYCTDTYNKICEVLGKREIVVAEFQCVDEDKLSRKKLNNALKSDSQFKATFEKLLRKFCDDKDNQSYIWAKLSKYDCHKFLKSIKTIFIEKVVNNESFRNSNEFKTIWKEKLANWLSKYRYISSVCEKTLGLITNHAYSVVNCFEKDGYRYITLQNPYNEPTSIDYSASKYQPRTLPKPPVHPDGTTAPNLFNMELAHFCKHLRYLNYTQ